MRAFVKTYLIALTLVLVAGLAITVAGIYQINSADYGRPRPTGAQLAPYRLSYRTGPVGSFTSITVEPDGQVCHVIDESQYLSTACVLALNIDPRFIAAEAFGKLNVEDTPSYEAILWRAAMEADATLCSLGGLVGERRAHCETVASKGMYERTDDNVTIRIGYSEGR